MGSVAGTGVGTTSGGSSGGSSGGGAGGCIIDRVLYPPRSNDPAHGARCCDGESGKWTPMFAKVGSYPVASVTEVGPIDGLLSDLNGDGLSDVVVTVYGRGDDGDAGQLQTWVYLSNDGGFEGPEVYAAQSGTDGPGWLALGDLNRDGIPDLVVSTSKSLDVRLGLGGGGFGSAVSTPTPCAAGVVQIIDANLDGWPDVAEVMNCRASPGALFLFMNQALGDGSLAAPALVTDETFGNNLSVGDYNGDGYPDMAYENIDGGISWIENTIEGFDGGAYVFPGGDGFPPVLNASLISYPLFEADAGPQMLSFSSGRGGSVICSPSGWPEDDSMGPNRCGPYISVTYDVEVVSSAVGDVDGDGLRDFLFAGPDWYDAGAGVDVLLSDPVDEFEAPPGGQGLPGLQPLQQILVGDLNRDAFGDLFVFRQDGPWEAWINTCGPGVPQ